MSGNQQKQTPPVAIVTGASGGIGEATARALHAAGYRVFGTYRRPPATRSPGIEYLACDVTSDGSVSAAVGEVLTKTGRIDLLVNNAGVGLLAGAEESSLEQAKSLFDVNLFGVIRMTKAVLPTMRRHGSGRIVNISSVMGLIPAPFMALYAASKHALEGYSESLDHEIRGSGVRVVLVEPAYTRTSFEGNVYQADQQLEVYRPVRSNAEAVFRDAMKHADAPELVASAVVKAATAATPRPRYTAGRMARQVSLLRRFVPEAAFDKSLRKQMRLPA
jgi:NAD(P)-dependent dehydrogenase (short-subunit alcohol dehydrogenase family)